jgi:hypothetical protein
MTLDLFLLEHPSNTTCFNSHWLPQRTHQLPLVTFENFCRNCEHAESQLGFKIGVPERLMSHLGVVTLQDPNQNPSSELSKNTFYKCLLTNIARGGMHWCSHSFLRNKHELSMGPKPNPVWINLGTFF